MNFLINLIIRPQRNVYNIKDLGENTFNFSGQDFKRLDFSKGEIKNSKGNKISSSLWCPFLSTNHDISTKPLIIYCHGNGGNKIDIIEIFEFLLWEFNICSFDFSGAGYSEGEYVTLGYYEKYDIKAVVDFLRKEFGIKNIILYGRSMGAVSCLGYSEMDSNIKACVLDSPFGDFPRLCEEILSDKYYIPSIMARFLINSARKLILEKIEGFDLENFIPSKNCRKIKVPTLMIHGKEDELVNISHSREIYKKINPNTYKILLEVDGLHNDSRPEKCLNTIRDFIMQYSYDSLVLKEHRRRLNIKNAHLSFNAKYSIDNKSIVDNFRLSHLNEISSKNYCLPIIKDSLFFKDYKKKFNNEEIKNPKNTFPNYNTENYKENRHLNNFNFDLNFINFPLAKKLKKINHVKSKSLDDPRNLKNKYSTAKKIVKKIFAEKLKNNQSEVSIKWRNNSFYKIKNENFYKNTLFREEENFFCFEEYENDKKINSKNFENNIFLNRKNSNKNIFSQENKKTDIFGQRNLNLTNKKYENDYIYKSEYFKQNNLCGEDENTLIELEKKKSFNSNQKIKENLEASLNSTQDTNNFNNNCNINYSDLYCNNIISLNISDGGSIIKSRRHTVLSGILNCDVKLDSSQITITNLDKSSLRRNRFNSNELQK